MPLAWQLRNGIDWTEPSGLLQTLLYSLFLEIQFMNLEDDNFGTLILHNCQILLTPLLFISLTFSL